MSEGLLIQGAPVSAGDRVVYPNGGICRVTGVESKQIAGMTLRMLMLVREEDGATVMVPENKVDSIGLRKVASAGAITVLFDYLTHSSADPELDWKVRHRDNYEKMAAGGLLDTAEVLKGLHALANLRALPTREREMYDSARHQLVGEIAAAMNLPLAVAENNIDYALDPPPGSGRARPQDAPIDLKSLRRVAPKRGPANTDEEDDEFSDEEEGDDEGLGLDDEESTSDSDGEETSDERADAEGDDEEAEPVVKPAAKKATTKKVAAKKTAAKKAPAKKAAAKKAPAKKTATKKAPAKKAATKKATKKTASSAGANADETSAKKASKSVGTKSAPKLAKKTSAKKGDLS